MKYFKVLHNKQINPPDAKYPDLKALAGFKDENFAPGYCAGVVLYYWTEIQERDRQCHCVVLETHGGVKLRDYQHSLFGETMQFDLFLGVRIVSIFGELKTE